jgi:CheY-like chemotaxis protein
LIILDINMPIMDGMEAGKKILDHYSKRAIMHSNGGDRNSNGSNQIMPLIFGLSSYVSTTLIKDTKAIGFTDCVQAPLDINKA